MRTATLLKLLLLTLTLAAAAYLISSFSETDEPRQLPYEDFRAPVRNPPVEPDRPDLFEEPGFIDPPKTTR